MYVCAVEFLRVCAVAFVSVCAVAFESVRAFVIVSVRAVILLCVRGVAFVCVCVELHLFVCAWSCYLCLCSKFVYVDCTITTQRTAGSMTHTDTTSTTDICFF